MKMPSAKTLYGNNKLETGVIEMRVSITIILIHKSFQDDLIRITRHQRNDKLQ